MVSVFIGNSSSCKRRFLMATITHKIRLTGATARPRCSAYIALFSNRLLNLTFSIADWLFGTSDLDRGLFGTLFNGYSRKYVRKGLGGLTAPMPADQPPA